MDMLQQGRLRGRCLLQHPRSCGSVHYNSQTALLAIRHDVLLIKVLASVVGAKVCILHLPATTPQDARCTEQRVPGKVNSEEQAIDPLRRPGCMHDTSYHVHGNEGCAKRWYPQATPICIWVPLSRSHRDRACCSCDSRRCLLRITKHYRQII